MSFFPGDLQYNNLCVFFVMSLNNIMMNVLLLMLICNTLDITSPTKSLPHCVNLVTQWHLPYHTFASVEDG